MTDTIIPLVIGPSVPLCVLQFAWSLEERGVAMTVEGATLVINPASKLTDAERVLVRKYKPQLVDLVEYCDSIQVKL